MEPSRATSPVFLVSLHWNTPLIWTPSGCGQLHIGSVGATRILQYPVRAENGGKCTFCGDYVSLTGDRLKDHQASSSDGGEKAAVQVVNSATQEALAFKDRLVEYDRNAAK